MRLSRKCISLDHKFRYRGEFAKTFCMYAGCLSLASLDSCDADSPPFGGKALRPLFCFPPLHTYAPPPPFLPSFFFPLASRVLQTEGRREEGGGKRETNENNRAFIFLFLFFPELRLRKPDVNSSLTSLSFPCRQISRGCKINV